MRKSFLSLTMAALFIITNTKAANGTGEIKNTKYTQLLLDNTFELMKVKSTMTSKIEPLDAEPKVEINDDYREYSVTAYTSGYESTQKKNGHPLYGITASGEKVKQGVTAACPKSLEFGTKVYIKELDHTYVCEDRGGAIKEGHLDIYYDSLKEAQAFGRKNLNVKIIDES